MDLGFVFKLSLYTLTAVVGVILGAAESEGISYGSNRIGMTLPFLSIPIVAIGYLFTERAQTRDGNSSNGLSSGWANLLGLVALGATIYEFTRERHEAKLLAGTHLLLYATWIVLFQQKTVRLYWFLMALGILQLAVASVLTTHGWFGFCALAYMFSAVWTLSIFSLWRAEQQFEEEENERRAETISRKRLEQTSVAKLKSQVRSAVHHEDGTQWLTGRFITGVLLTSCSALLVSAAFFAFVPRVWVGTAVTMSSDNDKVSGLGRRTSLSNTVRLGGLGPILESMDRAFEIQIKNLNTRKVISAEEYAERLGQAEPLFRASVMTHYDNGNWGAHSLNSLLTRPFQTQFKKLEIEQTVRLDSTESGVLFCMGEPLIMLDLQQQLLGELNEVTGVATLGERRSASGALVYSVYSTLPAKQPLYHHVPVSLSTQDQYSRIQYFEPTKRVPANLKRLKELTREIVDQEMARLQRNENQASPRRLSLMETATAIEAYLRDSGQFKYSLDQSIEDPSIDPIEDFLFNRKEGHCEYFATALTLMLRAANIPARLVSGYKGGVVRPDRKDWLEVQQRFAHAWVEAWVDNRGWTTFDPTPADERSLSLLAVAGKRTSLWTGVQSTLAGLWSDNVLNMSLDRQEQSIYKPLRELAFTVLAFVRKLCTSPASAMKSLFELLSHRERWFSVGGGLVAFSLMLIMSGLYWLIRKIVTGVRQWLTAEANRRTQARHRFIEFYERFARVMLTHGLSRSVTQTQQEFAEMVASAYSPELAAVGLIDMPQRVSSLFYRVRFGEQELSDEEVRDVEDLLTKLEHVVSNKPQ